MIGGMEKYDKAVREVRDRARENDMSLGQAYLAQPKGDRPQIRDLLVEPDPQALRELVLDINKHAAEAAPLLELLVPYVDESLYENLCRDRPDVWGAANEIRLQSGLPDCSPWLLLHLHTGGAMRLDLRSSTDLAFANNAILSTFGGALPHVLDATVAAGELSEPVPPIMLTIESLLYIHYNKEGILAKIEAAGQLGVRFQIDPRYGGLTRGPLPGYLDQLVPYLVPEPYATPWILSPGALADLLGVPTRNTAVDVLMQLDEHSDLCRALESGQSYPLLDRQLTAKEELDRLERLTPEEITNPFIAMIYLACPRPKKADVAVAAYHTYTPHSYYMRLFVPNLPGVASAELHAEGVTLCTDQAVLHHTRNLDPDSYAMAIRLLPEDPSRKDILEAVDAALCAR